MLTRFNEISPTSDIIEEGLAWRCEISEQEELWVSILISEVKQPKSIWQYHLPTKTPVDIDQSEIDKKIANEFNPTKSISTKWVWALARPSRSGIWGPVTEGSRPHRHREFLKCVELIYQEGIKNYICLSHPTVTGKWCMDSTSELKERVFVAGWAGC